MTTTGDVVDGMLASCYPNVHHDVAHIGMAPIRWFPDIAEWIFGKDNEVQSYATTAEALGMWVMPKGQ